MKQPLISILMPVKNTANYLKECLDSILKQTYQNWELLAVNDHSTDESPAILKVYSELDQRIQFIENQEKGIIAALRTAYQYSHGTLITRMDSDDLMPPQKLTVLAQNLLEAGRGHLATGGVEYFSAAILGEGYQRYSLWLNELARTGNHFSELYKECVIPSPCWMVFREDLDKCFGFKPNVYPEDYDLCFRFYEAGLKPIPCSEILHHWRDSAGRTSRHDANYADNRFLDIKIHYFLKLNHQPKRLLLLWGAGKKGKYIAQKLVEQNIDFQWICDNDKKIGHNIYGKILQSVNHFQIFKFSNFQIVIAVAQPEAQAQIKAFLEGGNLVAMEDYFFFC